MDIWSPEQLRRMQLGGTRRFQQFLAAYPRLQAPPRTSAALAARYGSRAATHYRRLLDARCKDGGDPNGLEAPPPDEGHLSAAMESNTGSHDSEGGGASMEGDSCGDTESAIGSLEEELAALEEAFLKQQRRLEGFTPQQAADSDAFGVGDAAAPAGSAETPPVVLAVAVGEQVAGDRFVASTEEVPLDAAATSAMGQPLVAQALATHEVLSTVQAPDVLPVAETQPATKASSADVQSTAGAPQAAKAASAGAAPSTIEAPKSPSAAEGALHS
eukprot:CAMPEP_0117547856 /NCGR_PEP_ID=MMETSP0784-20121206/47348_1 /TAXON_ID=39447 /ORGANISM="" /LENGTH=272 /DNA_ID=CAMNT_0005344791 /DNA_START=84 /DNA_END=902 /DNA_ORIENTATION=+